MEFSDLFALMLLVLRSFSVYFVIRTMILQIRLIQDYRYQNDGLNFQRFGFLIISIVMLIVHCLYIVIDLDQIVTDHVNLRNNSLLVLTNDIGWMIVSYMLYRLYRVKEITGHDK